MSSSRISAHDLGAVQETLLIPLVARATAATRHPDLGFRDDNATSILDRLDADTDRFVTDRGSMRGCVLRAQWFDEKAREFLARHPDALCLNLGAGLDGRAQRLGLSGDHVDWLDVDLPDVIALRNQLLPSSGHITNLEADIAAPRWLSQLSWPQGRPVIVLIEGVLMYLQPDIPKLIIAYLADRAREKQSVLAIAFDYISPLLAANTTRHRAVSKTQAKFAWSCRDPRDLIAPEQHFQITEHIEKMTSIGFVPGVLARLYRLLTGRRFYAFVLLMRREEFEMAPAMP